MMSNDNRDIKNMNIIIKIIINGNLHRALFIIRCSKALYTENKDNYANTVQIEINKII